MQKPSRDVLETMVAGVTPDAQHAALCRVLREATGLDTMRYSTFRDGFSLSRPHCLVVDKAGNSLGNLKDWAQARLPEHEGSHIRLWEAWKDSDLRLATADIEHLYFVGAYGDGPERFLQICVERWQWTISQRVFGNDPYDRPRSFEDLIDSSFVSSSIRIDPEPFGGPEYRLGTVTDVAEHLALIAQVGEAHNRQLEKTVLVPHDRRNQPLPDQAVPYFEMFPEQRAVKPNGIRLFDDWRDSSAGRAGAEFCAHWFIDPTDWTGPQGRRWVSLIPQWATAKKLPKIEPKRSMTAYGLYDKLLAFDAKAGYPFAWYFFMLHGNRIGSWAATMVLDAAEQGLIVLAEHDYRVLRRWGDHQYGF